MRFKNLIPAICIFLTACAIPIDDVHLARMNGIIGAPEQDLIYSWGVPDKVYTLDNAHKIITYSQSQVYDTGITGSACHGAIPSRFGYSTCFEPIPSRVIRTSCDYNFKITRGRVDGWFENGNGCPRTR